MKKTTFLNKIKKYFPIFLLAITCLVGCGKEETSANYDKDSKVESIKSQTVVENDAYLLKWDDFAKCILLESKETGEVYSDILYKAYEEGSTSAKANSALYITYEDMIGFSSDIAYSFDMDGNVRISSEKVENGIRVTYYFDIFEIAVPVLYELRDDSLLVSIDGSQIVESAESYRLISVTLAPYLASCENATDNYLFVPNGSGALMYTDVRAEGTRKYSAEIYGTDAARQILTNYVDEEKILLPVFGAKDADSGMLGIIEAGAGAVYIEGQAGYERQGYSNVGATVHFRGADTFRHGSYATGQAVTTRVSDARSTQTVQIGYYPLSGEQADFNGMATRYRDYLLENNLLQKSNQEASAYSVTFLGGTIEKKTFFGIPYETNVAMTDVSDANRIVKEIYDTTKTTPIVRMKAYGNNGLAPGKIAGGSKYLNVFGTSKEIKEFEEYCKKENISLLWEMNLIETEKANGNKVAKTAILKAAERYPILPTREFDEEHSYFIAGRATLDNNLKKALKKAEKYEHSGLSFDTLGTLAYGDHGDDKYIVKGQMEEDVRRILSTAKEDYVIATSGSYWYAAGVSDMVFDVPTGNGNYDVLDIQIPFYQMVFHSYVPMYGRALNLAENVEKELMLTASSGMGLSFTLTEEYLAESAELSKNALYGTVFKDNQKLIEESLQQHDFANTFKSIQNALFERYELIEKGISASYFSNGDILYANHTSETVNSPVGELQAYEVYRQSKGGE